MRQTARQIAARHAGLFAHRDVEARESRVYPRRQAGNSGADDYYFFHYSLYSVFRLYPLYIYYFAPAGFYTRRTCFHYNANAKKGKTAGAGFTFAVLLFYSLFIFKNRLAKDIDGTGKMV